MGDTIERNDSSISAESEEISKVQQSHPASKADREDNRHYAVALADWKSKVRKQRQELYVFQKHFYFFTSCLIYVFISYVYVIFTEKRRRKLCLNVKKNSNIIKHYL